jgi:hypothetical protein
VLKFPEMIFGTGYSNGYRVRKFIIKTTGTNEKL